MLSDMSNLPQTRARLTAVDGEAVVKTLALLGQLRLLADAGNTAAMVALCSVCVLLAQEVSGPSKGMAGARLAEAWERRAARG